MADFSAPDGSTKPLAFDTVQYLNTLPRYALGFLSGSGSAGWEQAVIVYLNGQRQAIQMGNFTRSENGFFWIPASSEPQEIMVVGWHKRGRPSGSLPWVSSNGDGICNGEVASWDDSKNDGDFNDYRVRFNPLPSGLHTLTYTRTLHPTDRQYVAKALVLLAGLRESANVLPADRAAKAIQRMNEAQAQLLRDYKANIERERIAYADQPNADRDCLPDEILLAAQIRLFANHLLEGSAKADLLGQLPVLLSETGRSVSDLT